MTVLEFFYNSWEWIVVIATAATIFTALIGVWKFILIDKTNGKIHSKIPMIIATSIMVIACAFVIAGGTVFMLCTKVPDIIDRSVAEAEELLNNANLNISFDKNTIHDRSNIISWQFQAEGSVVFKGSDVGVLVKEAGTEYETVNVPNVVGEKYEDAIALLINNDLQYRARIMGESDASLSQYYISYQSIASGSSIPERTVIDLELSLEKVDVPPVKEPSDLIPVPNLVGMEELDAVDLLLSIGLESSVYWIQGNDENADCYYILNQSIPEGSLVAAGTVIELERSPKQPGALVEVPSVVGMEQIEATSLLMKNGLQFQVWWTAEENEAPSDVYYIKGQSIEAGDIVPAGTLVKLELTSKNPNG